MKAVIVTIGDEILLGQITDTNSQYMAKQLADLGIDVVKIYSVSDKKEEIIAAADAALAQGELVLLTGGLGPTKDDLTKKVLADYFGTRLVFNEQAYQWVQELLAVRNVPMNAYNKAQACLPENCTLLQNRKGTASGMWFEKDGKVLISLPGVPFEMEYLMQAEVLPRVKEKYAYGLLEYRIIKVYDIPEAELAMRLAAFEDSLPSGLGLAYLPSVDMIKLRLTAKEEGVAQLNFFTEKLKQDLSGLRFLEGEENSVEERLADLLTKCGLTVACAESCTGGNIAHLITSRPGSSAYFLGGVVAYANDVKKNVLGVEDADLMHYGAVSKQVALQMAQGVRKITGADWSVSTTGIAGPDGGTPEKPVGTVWIAVAGPDGAQAREFHFSKTRERNIGKASMTALEMLLDRVQKN